MRLAWLGLALCLAPGAALAQGGPQRLHYVAYSTRFRVLDVLVDVNLGASHYSMDAAVHTIGVFGALVEGATNSSARGSWDGLAALPSMYDIHGVWHGEHVHTAMSYAGGIPTITALLPDNAHEREAVSPALQANTIDTLSAIAVLLHDSSQTGRCEGRSRVFDGRRLSEIAATTAGEEILPKTDRSTFQGPTLRCDFTGTLLAGFKFEDNRAREARPQHGTAWLARLQPGGPLLPMRVRFATPFFGDAILYLAAP